nr:hypothetical protein [Streptomyces boncukensis]
MRGELRAAADAHRPDRARMLARIARGVEEPDGQRDRARPAPRPRGRARSWALPRVAGAVGASVMVLGLGGGTVWWAQHTGGGPDGDSAHPTVRTSAGPAGPTASTGPAEARSASGPLRSRGSVNPGSSTYWSQTEVTVSTSEQLSTLRVELRVAARGAEKLESTGSWRTRPPKDFTVSVRREDGALVYRWTLRKGRSVPPGKHVFAGQFNHPGGERSTGHDAYEVSGTASERTYTVRGGIG